MSLVSVNPVSPVLARVTDISSAQILAIFTTPVTVVPAQGVGTMIVPVQMSVQYKFNTAPYTDPDGGANFIYAGVAVAICKGASITAGSSQVLPIPNRPLVQDYGPENQPNLENKALQLQNATTNPTVGDGTMRVAVLYYVFPLA